jgi:hypothetical protein
LSLEKYPRLDAWFKRCKAAIPGYDEVSESGIEMLKQFLLSKSPNAFDNLN